MARQPTTTRQNLSRDKAPPVGMTGTGTDPSTRPNENTDAKTEVIPPNTQGQQGAQRHEDMYTQTKPEDTRGDPANVNTATDQTDQDIADLNAEQRAELEAARLNAPDADDDLDPDAELSTLGPTDEDGDEDEDEDEEVLVRLLHDDGVHHVNGHPLESGTVVSMKRSEFARDQANGMRAEEVNPDDDDFDGEVYDASKPWKPKQTDKHGNEIPDEEVEEA